MRRAVFRTFARNALAFALAWSLAIGGACADALAFDLRIEHGHLRDGREVIHVHQGDVVTLRFSSDRRVVLHLHGYEIETQVEAGGVGEIRFEARATGRFPIHLHAGNTGKGGRVEEESTLVYVEVYPR